MCNEHGYDILKDIKNYILKKKFEEEKFTEKEINKFNEMIEEEN